MIDWGASVVKSLDTFFASLGASEAAIIGPLIVSLISLSLLFVLLRRRLKGAAVQPAVRGVEPSEAGAQGVSDVAAVQAELRELIREFSALAEQVLRTLDRDQAPPRLPDAGGAALQLLDLGLTPSEAARTTGMTMGEVALLMNLRKAKASKFRLSETSVVEAQNVADLATDSGGSRGDGRGIEVNGDERRVVG